ncbi:unnamed protein product [Linum tenue]|uniref:Rieske domain-containing protein n=1 Tax=Linum tenue TaxID=586396 RepID=A0AAV0MDS5_9ROSI|nr:unnamed protein product [Linum tenue]
MEAYVSSASLPSLICSHRSKPKFANSHSSSVPTAPSQPLLRTTTSSKFKLFSSPVSVEVPLEAADASATAAFSSGDEEKFDWYSQWYPVMPVCDLDERVPHAKKVLGMDVVVWWDRNENAWKVFDDMCPHRLAPLSEGRIDPSGRLQCVYHGWCFDGSGDCKLIPQAPLDGPPVHTSKRACVAVYPAIVHHDIVWFWPNSDPQYKDIFEKKKPPFIPELGDPSFTKIIGNRDVPYGYDVLIENLADPAHLPYAHYGLPSIERKTALVFMCIPVSPGHSRLIWVFPRNFDVWVDKVLPRWMTHMGTNLLLDSDLYLLHIEERKIKEIGPENWQKACFLPAKSDGLVVGFRRWFNKYADSEVDWRGKYTGELPPTPPREQLMDRYWTHVVNCSSCNCAYKCLNAAEIILKVVAVAIIGVVAATKQGVITASTRTGLAILAALCYAASKWLAHFVYDNFRYHDYNHSFPEKVMLFLRIFGLGIAL